MGKRYDGFVKFVLFLNIIGLLVGLFLAAVGAFSLYWNAQPFSSLVDAAIIPDKVTLEHFFYSLHYFESLPGGIMLAFGLFIIIICLLAIIAVGKNNMKLFFVYLVLWLLFLVGQAAMYFLILFGKFDESMESTVRASLEEGYVGFRGNDAASYVWDIVMINNHCCGLDGPEDFQGATNWQNPYTLDNGENITLLAPIACCTPLPAATVTPDDVMCATTPAVGTTYYIKGCYDDFYDIFHSFQWIISIGAILIFQLFFVCSSCAVGSIKLRNDD